MPRLRVLSAHPHLGVPNDVIDAGQDAQAYVDAGFAEWIGAPAARVDVTPVADATPVETTAAAGAVEVTAERIPPGRGGRRSVARTPRMPQ